MSAATAPVWLNANALAAMEPSGSRQVRSLPPQTPWRATMALLTRSRQSVLVASTRPSGEMTSRGSTTVPAVSAGSSPPANPQLRSARAPASRSRRAPLAAAADPTPLRMSRVPSARVVGWAPCRVAGPSGRDSAASAATIPSPFNAGFRAASGCDRPPTPRAGNRRNSRGTADRTPAESPAP